MRKELTFKQSGERGSRCGVPKATFPSTTAPNRMQFTGGSSVLPHRPVPTKRRGPRGQVQSRRQIMDSRRCLELSRMGRG